MTDTVRFQSLSALLLSAALLSGCTAQGGSTDDRLGHFLVSPGKYEFYTCPQLAVAAKSLVSRERELSNLMAKAGDGAGGSFVSIIAYRPEYSQVRGDINELRSAAAAKNCNLASYPGVPAAPANAAR